MIAVEGTYQNGHVTFKRKIKTSKPVKVIITFLEEIEATAKTGLKPSDFSFSKARKALKNYKGLLSYAVIEERRNA